MSPFADFSTGVGKILFARSLLFFGGLFGKRGGRNGLHYNELFVLERHTDCRRRAIPLLCADFRRAAADVRVFGRAERRRKFFEKLPCVGAHFCGGLAVPFAVFDGISLVEKDDFHRRNFAVRVFEFYLVCVDAEYFLTYGARQNSAVARLGFAAADFQARLQFFGRFAPNFSVEKNGNARDGVDRRRGENPRRKSRKKQDKKKRRRFKISAFHGAKIKLPPKRRKTFRASSSSEFPAFAGKRTKTQRHSKRRARPLGTKKGASVFADAPVGLECFAPLFAEAIS